MSGCVVAGVGADAGRPALSPMIGTGAGVPGAPVQAQVPIGDPDEDEGFDGDEDEDEDDDEEEPWQVRPRRP